MNSTKSDKSADISHRGTDTKKKDGTPMEQIRRVFDDN